MTTDNRKYNLLCRLRGGMGVAEAARLTGISTSTAYAWRKADAAFAEQWDEAVAEARRTLWLRRGGAGRPPLPDRDRAVQVPMRIRAGLLPKLQALGREWLETAVEQAPDI